MFFYFFIILKRDYFVCKFIQLRYVDLNADRTFSCNVSKYNFERENSVSRTNPVIYSYPNNLIGLFKFENSGISERTI